MPKIAAFGGAYANPYALEAMLVDARARGCERTCSLGDLGGFGAECDAVWPLLSAHGVECVAGNYDIAIGRGDPIVDAATPIRTTTGSPSRCTTTRGRSAPSSPPG